MQFKALSHMGKPRPRAAMLGLTPSNQRIGGPTRTITWISEVGPKGWVQQGEEKRAPGEEGAGSKAALAFHRSLWCQRSCPECGANVSPHHGEAVTWPRPGINAALRHQRPGRRKKKRIVIKFTKSFYVPKHLYVLTLSMRKLLLAFLKES